MKNQPIQDGSSDQCHIFEMVSVSNPAVIVLHPDAAVALGYGQYLDGSGRPLMVTRKEVLVVEMDDPA